MFPSVFSPAVFYPFFYCVACAFLIASSTLSAKGSDYVFDVDLKNAFSFPNWCLLSVFIPCYIGAVFCFYAETLTASVLW
jgi:hypothetical protein